MIGVKARNDWVIVVQSGNESDYFTLDGIYIGSIVSGARIVVKEPEPRKPSSGIVRSPAPKEVVEQKQKEVADLTGFDERTPDTDELIKKAVQK